MIIPHRGAKSKRVSGALQLTQARKKNIQLTYHPVKFLCITISQMYELQEPSELYPPDVKWVHEECAEERIICARVWEARRSILDLYGWASYHLHRDLCPWHERDWRPGFVTLDKLLFLARNLGRVVQIAIPGSPTSSTHHVEEYILSRDG